MDRQARSLIAVALLTTAAFLGAELLIRRAPLVEWPLTLVLAVLGLVFVAWSMRKETPDFVAAPEAIGEPAPALTPGVRVYPVTREAPAAPAPAPAAVVAPSPEAAPAAYDLTALDGIGPKTAEALHEAGVTSFAQLAEMTPAALRDLMAAAHVRIVGDSIDTWPAQAKLAAAGDWDGMAAWIAAHKRSGGDD